MTSHPNNIFLFPVGLHYSITAARSQGAYKMIVAQDTPQYKCGELPASYFWLRVRSRLVMNFPLLSGFKKWNPARESRLRTGWTLGTEKYYVAELPIVIKKKKNENNFFQS